MLRKRDLAIDEDLQRQLRWLNAFRDKNAIMQRKKHKITEFIERNVGWGT